MSKVSFKNIQAGQELEVGYRDHADPATFLGFTDNTKKYSQEPRFKNAKELLEFAKVTTFAALEEFQDRDGIEKYGDVGKAYGYHFYAVFKCKVTGEVYTAYLFKGRWCLGSSADYAKLK